MTVTDLPNDAFGRAVSVDSENGTSTYSVWSDFVNGDFIFSLAFDDDWPLASVYSTINSMATIMNIG
jgi:hypothetical protein